MELVFIDPQAEKEYSGFKMVDFKRLTAEIEQSPLDYIFLMDPDERDQFRRLYGQVKRHYAGESVFKLEADFPKKYPWVAMIFAVILNPKMMIRYYLTALDDKYLDPMYPLFFMDRQQLNTEQRIAEMAMRLHKIKANTPAPSGILN